MKKILFASIFALSTLSVKAQTGTFDDIFFTNLYAKGTLGLPGEQPNYHISNIQTPAGWVLDTSWWGGIQFKTQNAVKLKSRYGTVYISETGNTGINNENPTRTLTVNGDIGTIGKVGIGTVGETQARLDVVNDNNQKTLINFQDKSAISFIPNNGNSWFHISHGLNDDLAISHGNSVDFGRLVTIKNNGNMAVNGKFEAKEIKVTLTPTADFVFEENYGLPKLKDVEKFIKENKHLPEVASAKVMEKEGVNVGEFQIKLLQKIEELTLYVIEQQKKIEILEKQIKISK